MKLNVEYETFVNIHTTSTYIQHPILPSKLGPKCLNITLWTEQAKLVYVMWCFLTNKWQAVKNSNTQYSKTFPKRGTN